MSHTMKSWGGRGRGSNTWICLSIWRFSSFSPACTWLHVRSQTVLSLHGVRGTLCATLSWSFSIVLKGCSSLHLLFTTHFPQGDLRSVLLQALHGSSWRPSWRNSPSLCHWVFWLHLVVSCRRWCWPWTGMTDGHWLHSPTACASGKPFQSWVGEGVSLCSGYQWSAFPTPARASFSVQKGLLSVSVYTFIYFQAYGHDSLETNKALELHSHVIYTGVNSGEVNRHYIGISEDRDQKPSFFGPRPKAKHS